MKLWTQPQLAQLHRDELLELFRAIESNLLILPEASAERRVALDNLAAIRMVLNRPSRMPERGGWKPPAP